ncbi:MAG: hypothetical protein MJ000_11010 [Bacteroidales bacterium]|nr:hypothetical protein [Bacteroidales bacterium]
MIFRFFRRKRTTDTAPIVREQVIDEPMVHVPFRNHVPYVNPDIIKMFAMAISEFKEMINKNKQKTQKAMRITLILKLITTLASIYSISAWLEDHDKANWWALILVLSEIAGVLLDTLPFFQQRIELPKVKLKLEHIYFDMIEDFNMFQRAEIDEKEALRRYWSHRRSWVQATSK